MKLTSTIINSKFNFLIKKINFLKKKEKLKITNLDENSTPVTIEQIGITSFGDGVVILKTEEGLKFPISSFSAEVAKSISDFKEGVLQSTPSIYNMLENICENTGLVLVKVKIYDNGKALRANLYFTGRKDLVLRNYRASDALALAAFYSIPILIKKDLLKQSPKIDS